MYLYFNRIGTLKEIISDVPTRVGNHQTNEIYVYVEELEPDSCTVRYVRPNDEAFPGLTSIAELEDTIEYKEIPYDKTRDLKFFKYGQTYKFIKFVVPDEVLSQSGVVGMSIKLISEGLMLGLVTFNVEYSAEEHAGFLLNDGYLSISQWNYLIKLLNDKIGSIIEINITEFDSSNTLEDLMDAAGINTPFYFKYNADVFFGLITKENHIYSFIFEKVLTQEKWIALDYNEMGVPLTTELQYILIPNSDIYYGKELVKCFEMATTASTTVNDLANLIGNLTSGLIMVKFTGTVGYTCKIHYFYTAANKFYIFIEFAQTYIYVNAQNADTIGAMTLQNLFTSTKYKINFTKRITFDERDGSETIQDLYNKLGETPAIVNLYHTGTFYGEFLVNIDYTYSGSYQFMVDMIKLGGTDKKFMRASTNGVYVSNLGSTTVLNFLENYKLEYLPEENTVAYYTVNYTHDTTLNDLVNLISINKTCIIKFNYTTEPSISYGDCLVTIRTSGQQYKFDIICLENKDDVFGVVMRWSSLDTVVNGTTTLYSIFYTSTYRNQLATKNKTTPYQEVPFEENTTKVLHWVQKLGNYFTGFVSLSPDPVLGYTYKLFVNLQKNNNTSYNINICAFDADGFAPHIIYRWRKSNALPEDYMSDIFDNYKKYVNCYTKINLGDSINNASTFTIGDLLDDIEELTGNKESPVYLLINDYEYYFKASITNSGNDIEYMIYRSQASGVRWSYAYSDGTAIVEAQTLYNILQEDNNNGTQLYRHHIELDGGTYMLTLINNYPYKIDEAQILSDLINNDKYNFIKGWDDYEITNIINIKGNNLKHVVYGFNDVGQIVTRDIPHEVGNTSWTNARDNVYPY